MESENEIENEASATVQEVLAFIDACEAATKTLAPGQTKPARPRSQIGHEMNRLRREAKYLEMRLLQLKNGTQSSKCSISILKTEEGRSKWIEAVLQEYRRYQQSKRVNRVLKTRLAWQQEVASALNMQIMMVAQNRAMEDFQIMASLTGRLNELELDMENIMSHVGLAQADSLTARTLRKVEPGNTLVLEKAFCWPMRCSVEHADQYMTSRYGRKQAAIKSARDSAKLTKVTYFDHEKQPYELRTKTAMHRIPMADRVVFLQSSLFLIVSEHLSFVEDCIYVVRRPAESSDSVALPASGSFLLGWHRIRAVQHNSSESALQSLKEVVMAISSDRIVSKWQKAKSRIQGVQQDKGATSPACRHARLNKYK